MMQGDWAENTASAASSLTANICQTVTAIFRLLLNRFIERGKSFEGRKESRNIYYIPSFLKMQIVKHESKAKHVSYLKSDFILIKLAFFQSTC